MKEEHNESTNLEGCTNLLNTIEKLAELKSQAEDLQQQIQNLQEQATNLQQATVAEIADRTNADASFAEVLAAEISERKSAIVDLQATVNSFSDTYATSAELEAIGTQVSNSSTEISDVRANIEDIVTSLQNVDSNVEDVNTKLSNIFSAENFVEDFDTAIEPGIYCWSESSKNRPANYGVLLVYAATVGNSNWINQIAYSTSDKIYFRQKIDDNEWRAWQTIAFEDITKTYTIPDVTTATTRYIKLGTFPWNFSEKVKVVLSGANLEDTVEFNVLGGNGKNSNVCGWYTTNSAQTKSIIVVPVTPGSSSSNIEVWLQVTQATTLTVKLIGNAKAAQYFNTNAQMNNTQTSPGGKAFTFTLGRGFFGYNENALNCYETTMTGLGFTKDQVVSLTQFAQAVINYTGTNRGRIHFTWSDAQRAYIKATTPYNTQLEISGGTLTFNTQNVDVDAAWNTFDAEYVNRDGELFTFGIYTDGANLSEYVRKGVDTSGKAATAGTADTAKGWQKYALSLKGLSNSNFYPVVIDTGFNFVDVEIYSESVGGHLPYNQNRIKFTISAAGWSDTPKNLFISEYNRYEDNEVTIGCIGYCTEDATKAVIWLRGGIEYTCYTMNCPSALSVKTVDTALGNSIVTVGTSYSGGTNTKVSILFTPKSTMSSGIYSSTGMTTARNLTIKSNTDVTLSSFGQEPLSIGDATGDNLGIDSNEIQARFKGAAAPLYINGSGGKVNINDTGADNGGLRVGGNTTLQSNTSVSLSNFGKEPLSIGAAAGKNIGIDEDDIQARNNGAAATLDLNYLGGTVRVNGYGNSNGGLTINGHLNIPVGAPSNPVKGDIWLVL